LAFDAHTLTLGKHLDRWLSDSVGDTVRPGSFVRYEQITRLHVTPALGGLRLKNVTLVRIRGLYREKLDAGLSGRTVYVLAVHCGLRQGELLDLKWEDTDLPSGVLRVRRTLSVAKDGPIFNPPKTAKGRRTVALTDGAASALEAHLWRRLSQAEVLGDDDYLARP
jgi:hypothetical protein